MSTTSTSPPRARLTPTARKAAEHAAAGRSNTEIARQMRLLPGEVSRLLTGIADTYGGDKSRPALIRAVLADGLIDLPIPRRPAPDLTDRDVLLLCSIAHFDKPDDVAKAAGLDGLSDLVVQTNLLVSSTGARNATHMVALAHLWGLLGPVPAATETPTGAIGALDSAASSRVVSGSKPTTTGSECEMT